MIITGNKLNKLRVEGNCVPIMLVDINLYTIGSLSGTTLEGINPSKICKDAVHTLVQELPITYRASAKKRAWSIAKSLYSKYLEPECKNTTKILMAVHNWIYRLAEEGRIDMGSQEFIDMVEEITHIYSAAEEEGFTTTIDGKQVQRTGQDVKKRMTSALKHVTKLHGKAMDRDLYMSIRADGGELFIVN